MKRKVLALIMPLVLLVPSLNSISVNADNYVDYGTIQVTIIDEETQELFNEDRYCFSVTGSGMHLDSWNPAESNPHTITDVQKQFKYMVQYIAKDYDGYTYYIDAEKSEPLISFADDDVKEVTVYMKKNIWGSSTTNPETPDSTELKTFEELYALKENELKQYCSDHKINYISPEEAKNQIANKCGINIMVKPNDYLINADGDLLESEDLSAFNKSNIADYDFGKMVSDLQYPESDYKFDSAKNDFAFYSVSEPDNNGNPKQKYLKLAQVHIDINTANSNRSSERLYQLMAIWAEQNPIVYTVSLEKVGASSAAEEEKTGDVNNDGEFNISDVVLLQKWLLAVPDTHLANWKAADFCEDNALNVFDLCLMKRALIEQRISEGQPVLYCEGEKIGESDEKGWYSTEYSNVITDKQLKDNPDILSRLDKVNAKADELKSTQMIDWKWGVEDYGEDYLYLPYVDENGNADRILLCKFGWDCAWLDDADVQMLVSMLIGNGYYADKTLFEYYIEDQ